MLGPREQSFNLSKMAGCRPVWLTGQMYSSKSKYKVFFFKMDKEFKH